MLLYRLKRVAVGAFWLAASWTAGAQAPASAPAPTATATQAPVAEIDAIAYDNLRNAAQRILELIGGLGDSFIIYQPQLFARLPLYLPALREVDGVRVTLCSVKTLTPPIATAALTTTLDAGSSLSGIAAVLALFKPSLTVAGLELPPSDQALIADFASVAISKGKGVFIPGTMPPTLEPTDPFADNACPASLSIDPYVMTKNPSISQEWRAADTIATQVARTFAGWTTAQQNSAVGKSVKDALDNYAAILKKQTTTDATGNSPLATYVQAGRLSLLLEKSKPLVLVLGTDDLGGTGWVKSKAFTVPVTYSGGASCHYYVFSGSDIDSRALAAGTVTSMDAGLEQKAITDSTFQDALTKNRIVLPKK
jgi:hypothetical protein